MAKKVQKIQGTVVAHNLSPRGDIEGMMIETALRTVQVNLPKHGGTIVPVGQLAAIDVEGHDSEGSHDVFLAREASDSVEGKVVRLNHSRHGEVNGYVLEDGTFVHTKPDGARRLKIKVGAQISASGERRVGPHATVIEADTVKAVKS
ncbi:MAG TPA: hypothetical protein VGC41_18810 [Kofleriaceae bacterium]